MIKRELSPPQAGLNADPVLYGVAAGLAELFPPVAHPNPDGADPAWAGDADADEAPEEA